jgi:hypothetical protein
MVLERPVPVAGKEGFFDARPQAGLLAQFPVRDGTGRKILDLDRRNTVGGQRIEISAPGVDIALVVLVDSFDRSRHFSQSVIVAASNTAIGTRRAISANNSNKSTYMVVSLVHALEFGARKTGVQHIPKMKPDMLSYAVPGRLIVGEVNLVLRN